MPTYTNRILYRVLAIGLVYFMLKVFGGSLGQLVLYPVTLLVTFLHELGHALGSVLTGGGVTGLQINPDGSGYTTTIGGNRAVILMGGYLGSALLGNLLFFIGARHKHLTDKTLYVLAGAMVFASIVWFESLQSTVFLWAFAASLYLIASRTDWDQDVLMFLGFAAVLYIIQDFNVGPSSDLAMYEQTVGIFPAQVWMYVWLALAGLLFFFNLKNIFRTRRT